MVLSKQYKKKMEKLQSISVGNVNLQEKLNMKIVILIGIIILLSSCKNFDGFDPTTSSLKWILTNDNRK
tara:strand:+ start:91 stop:297 length:207 start_codon:yes stop_codon:yes gene_type:complete